MWVNIYDIEMFKVENYQEALKAIKEKLAQWMQEGDQIVQTVREVWDTDEEPGHFQVYNERCEPTDAFAEILDPQKLPQKIKHPVADKILGGRILSFSDYKLALACHYLLNKGADLKAEYDYLKNVWHYEDDKIRGFLNFEKPDPDQDPHGFRPVSFGVYMSQVQREYLNEQQIEEFKKHGWKDEEIGH